MGTWIAVIVATVALLGVAAVRSARRRRRAASSTMDTARAATRELGRESRHRRGIRGRGTGDHFGRTKVKKYGDERHEDEAGGSDGGSGGSDGGGGGGGGGSD